MKKYFVTFLAFLMCISAASARKKVGVVLSGGGAKGMAHIGALKVIEEAGIPIDYVVGTSMGSIIGGLYSIGYTPAQIDSMVACQDWSFVLTDKARRSYLTFHEKERAEKYLINIPFHKRPTEMLGSAGMVKGQNLANLFAELTPGYHDSIDFNQLPIPFACVAENIVDGKEVVFHSGNLTTAMRASMSIPGAFAPVRLNGMVLVDGGMKNNFPVSVAKDMGADIIIGVDVQDELKTADEINNVGVVLNQIIALSCQETFRDAREKTDVYIKVNVKGYSSASFKKSAIDTLIWRGEQAAGSKYQELVALKEKIGIAGDFRPAPHGPFAVRQRDTVFIKDIDFSGVELKDEARILSACRLMKNSQTSVAQIKEAISILYGTMSYSSVNYKLLENKDNTYNLLFLLNEKRESSVNLGIRFDSEELAAALMNATFQLRKFGPAQLSLTSRLGKRSDIKAEYSYEPWRTARMNLSYKFAYNDLYIYDLGDRSYNLIYKQQQAELSFADIWRQKMRVRVGARFDYFEYEQILIPEGDVAFVGKDKGYMNYFASIKYDSFDENSFPRNGVNAGLEYTLYTDDGLRYDGGAPLRSFVGYYDRVIPVTNRFCILPAVYGRTVWDYRKTPYNYMNCIGGLNNGRYLAHQLPFVGVSYVEIVDFTAAVGRLSLRQRMGARHYLTAIGNVMATSTDVSDMLHNNDVDYIWGAGLMYGYKSPLGPIQLLVDYSDRTKDVGIYFNVGFFF